MRTSKSVKKQPIFVDERTNGRTNASILVIRMAEWPRTLVAGPAITLPETKFIFVNCLAKSRFFYPPPLISAKFLAFMPMTLVCATGVRLVAIAQKNLHLKCHRAFANSKSRQKSLSISNLPVFRYIRCIKCTEIRGGVVFVRFGYFLFWFGRLFGSEVSFGWLRTSKPNSILSSPHFNLSIFSTGVNANW